MYAPEVLMISNDAPLPLPKLIVVGDVGVEMKLLPVLSAVYGADKEIVFVSMFVTKIVVPEPLSRAAPISIPVVSLSSTVETGAVNDVVILIAVSEFT